MPKNHPIECPNCNKRYRLPASYDRPEVVCKRCQQTFTISHSSEGVKPGVTPSHEEDAATVFDSLDVNELLNAPAPAPTQEKPKRRRTKRKQLKREELKPAPKATGGTKTRWKTPNTAPAENNKPVRQSEPAKEAAGTKQTHPDPDLIKQELEFAWAKKKKKSDRLNPVSEKSAPEPVVVSNDAENSQPELDDEELAIFAAVTRQNRRRNMVWGTIAAILVILVGGYFARSEFHALNTPLTQDERDWLTQQGFVLKASHIKHNEEDDGTVVTLINGADFSDIDQFKVEREEPENLANGMFDNLGNRQPGNRPAQIAPLGPRQAWRDDGPNRQRQPRQQPQQQRKAYIDTNADSEPNPNTPQLAPVGFTTKLAIERRASVAHSPRKHFYVADRESIIGLTAAGEVFEQRSLPQQSETGTVIAATPDGRRLILGSRDGQVQSFQLDSSGRLTAEFKLKHVHRDSITHLIPTNDSRHLIVYSADGRLTAWELSTQQIELSLSDLPPRDRLKSFQLSGDQILISTEDSVRTISLQQQAVQREKFAKPYRVCVPDRSGKSLFISNNDQIGVIDRASKQSKWSRAVRFRGNPQVRFSPDRETVFFFDGGRDVLQMQISSGKTTNRFRLPDSQRVVGITINSEGSSLLVEGNRNERYLYHVPGHKAIKPLVLKEPLPLPPRKKPPTEIAFDSDAPQPIAAPDLTSEQLTAACLDDNGFLFVADRNNRILVHDWQSNRTTDEQFGTKGESVSSLAAFDGHLLVGKSTGILEVITIDDGGKLGSTQTIAGKPDPIIFILPIPATSHLATVTQSGHVKVLDTKTWKAIYDGRPIESRVMSVVVAPTSDILLADGRQLVTLDYPSGVTRVKEGNTSVKNVTLLPDGKRLAFFDRNKANFATTSRGDINLSIDAPLNANGISFSPDAKLAFIMTRDTVTGYRMRGGKEIFSFPHSSQSGKPTTTLFSGDGKFMTTFAPMMRGRFEIYPTPQF